MVRRCAKMKALYVPPFDTLGQNEPEKLKEKAGFVSPPNR
jgi:hypothetical protein